MLHVTVLAVGKLKEAYLTQAIREYQKRLGAFCKFSMVEAEEHRLPANPSPAEIEKGLEREGKALLTKLPSKACAVALCIEGKELDSPAFAKIVEDLSRRHSHLAFLIGGSHGLSEEVKARAALRLSLSRMTFPHQLARVLLCEQLYRGFSILSHGKYHK